MWTTKYKILLEKCIVPHVETKSVFTFQPRKRLVSTTVRSAKPAATFCLFLLWTRNRQLCCLFGGDGTHCFARKTSRNYEKEKSSPFLKKFLRQSQPSTSESEPKKVEMFTSIYGISVSTPHCLKQLTKSSFTLSFYTLSVYIQAK